MSNNEITINPVEIFLQPDNSITDAETIRQIALWSIKFNDDSLSSKIKANLRFAGLYPHVQQYQAIDPELIKEISESGREYMSKILEDVHAERIAMKVNPERSMIIPAKLEGQEPRVAAHYIVDEGRGFGKKAKYDRMLDNDENYQKDLVYDKYELKLEAKENKVGMAVGSTMKFTNEIFNEKNGIAFFQIDPCWKLLWSRKFTGYFDQEKTEIYDGDYLEDEKTIYLVKWNRNQTQWWLEPVKNKMCFDKVTASINGDESMGLFDYAMSTQSLGNGYFKRDDLLKIGNKYENPEILNHE